MADGGPIHVEGHVEGPDEEWPRPGRGSSSRRLVRGRRRSTARLVLAAVAVGASVSAGVSAWLADDGDGGRDRKPGEAAPAEPPRSVWAEATLRLGAARSFAYRGTVHAAEPSAVRPGRWLATDVTVDGAVLLPQSISREVAVDARGRAVETVTSGPTAWSRAAPSRGRLAAAPWRVARSPAAPPPGWDDGSATPRLGVALVSDALRATGNRSMDPPDGSGRRVLHGSLPDRVRGANVDALPEEAELSLVLDGDGDIVHVTLAAGPADDPSLEVDLAIDRIGRPGLVTAADVGEPARRTVPMDVLAAAGVEPLELGRVPSGWALTDAQVWDGRAQEEPAPPGCAGLSLEYRELGATRGRQLSLSVASERCRAGKGGRFAFDDRFRAGAFTGTVYETATVTVGIVSDGVTSVGFQTDLSADDAAAVLASLVPFDPARAP